jgi:hypothetical protein
MNLARQAIKVWPHHPTASRATTNSIRRKWIATVQRMGDKWLFHEQNFVRRKES